MTWAEFRRQMEAAGVEEHHEIAWIDIGSCDRIEVINRSPGGRYVMLNEDPQPPYWGVSSL